jgi:ABC-type multidrug transport system fused ATPase/permease subunit
MISKLFLDFLKQYPLFMITNIMLMFLVPINEVGMSYLYGKLFDAIQNNTFTMNHFYVILGTLIFLQLGWGVSDFNYSRQISDFQHYCKKKFVSKIFNDSKNNFKELSSAELLSSILRTKHILADWYVKIFNNLFPILIQLIITIIYFTMIDVQLAIYITILITIFLIFMYHSPNICKDLNTKVNTQMNSINNSIADVLNNYLSVYKEQSLDDEIELFDKEYKTYQKDHKLALYCTSKYRFILSALIIMFLVLFVRRSYHIMKKQLIVNAVFYSIFMILSNTTSNIIYFIDVQRDMTFDWNLIQSSGFFDEIPKQNKLECVPNVSIKEDNILEIKDLDYKYPNTDKYVLKNINLEIKKGERLAITGHIGSGKSTVLKIILKLIQPSKGNMYIKGNCAYDIPVKEYYNIIGFMPQNCILFNRSILDNVMYDNKSITEQEVIYTMKKFGIMEHFTNMKKGVHSNVGINGSNLSGGQRQLLWILRMYFKNPDIIIMDEPTASLDKETKDLFISMINKLMKNKTIIIVTHDMYMVKHVSRTVDMEKINNK